VEAVMRAEQSKLTDFMDRAPVGFYSIDEDGRFHFANATLVRWLGVDANELVHGGYRLHDFLVDPPADALPFAIDPVNPFSQLVETAMRSRNGRIMQVSIAQDVVQDPVDGSVWTRSVVRDHTHMRQIREALRVSEARFKRFFDAAPIGLAFIDHDGRLNEWNPAFETMFTGIAEIELGMRISTLFGKEYQSGFLTRLRDSINKRDTDTPFEFHTPGEDHRAAAVFLRHLEIADSGTPGVMAQFIDQTEQKSLEQQFTQSQKMQAIGQLAGGIAHDFNNLLTAMIGFCDLLLLRHKVGDSSFTDIMQIKQNANRAANLVRQLLAFSRQQTLQPRLITVTDPIAELSHLLQRLIGENIELEMIHGRDLGLVMADAGQLEQVIINLAVNARDAMPSGGKLQIKTGSLATSAPIRHGNDEMPPGDYIYIRVSDTGEGISPTNLDRIFEPFFSTKDVGKGTGLGLSTVYGIIRQTEGYIGVSSKVGEGTELTIYLPVAQPASEVEPEAPKPPPAARDLTGIGNILLVEDEDPVRLFSARALRNKGYAVIEARSGMEALEHLKERADNIDLLITDVVMPEIDGPTLIAHAREKLPELKVICISGYTEDRFRPSEVEGPPIHFLAKPFSLQQLATKVKDVVLQA
ncbi:MAG: ATP-binding protein, partial [Pseudomonadota bacterium]